MFDCGIKLAIFCLLGEVEDQELGEQEEDDGEAGTRLEDEEDGSAEEDAALQVSKFCIMLALRK